MAFKQYEYRVVTMDTKGWSGGILNVEETQETLNQLGEQGWELVSTVSTHMGNGITRCIVHYFKREV